MTVFLGLTGSIGMGKSTTAQMFRDAGIPVHDSDATVHRLYAGEAAALIEAAFPGSTKEGVVDRGELGKRVVGNDEAMKQLESIVHPLVRREEQLFRTGVSKEDKPLAVLDIPLLFETGGEARVDGVVVITAPAEVQRQRVLARPGMTEERFEGILARQVPDSVKRQKADFVIDSSLGLESARKEVHRIIDLVSKQDWNPSRRNAADA